MTKPEREEKEYKSLYTDERYAKQAFKRLINKSLQSNVAILPDFEDAHGNTTPQSAIYKAATNSVRARLLEEGLDREPMKAEVLIEASVIRAAFDNNTLNLILDRTAGKVKEEISIGVGQYEDLSDEELRVLAAHRQARLTAPKGEDDA
jgi:hypothetical protein